MARSAVSASAWRACSMFPSGGAVAAGNLGVQFDSSGKNEIAQLLQALQDMQTALVQVVHNVRQINKARGF